MIKEIIFLYIFVIVINFLSMDMNNRILILDFTHRELYNVLKIKHTH